MWKEQYTNSKINEVHAYECVVCCHLFEFLKLEYKKNTHTKLKISS